MPNASDASRRPALLSPRDAAAHPARAQTGLARRHGHWRRPVALALLSTLCVCASAKLPPASDEAKAKAAETAAKAAHGNKVADYQLCTSMDRVAGRYQADAKKAAKELKPATATPPCADPGAFVYVPPAAASAAAGAASSVGAAPPATTPKKP